MEHFDIASLKTKKAPATKKSVSISIKPTKSIFGSISKKTDKTVDSILNEDDDEKTKKKTEEITEKDSDETPTKEKADDSDDEDSPVKLLLFDKRKTAFINRNNILERINETIIENRLVSKAPVVLENTEQMLSKKFEKLQLDSDKEKSKDDDEESKEDDEESKDEDEESKDEEQTKADEEKSKDDSDDEEEEVAVEKPKKRQKKSKSKTDEYDDEDLEDIDFAEVTLGSKIVSQRLPPPEKILVKASPHYLYNRKIFIQKLSKLLEPYRKELDKGDETISCENLRNSKSSSFKLLTHQKVVTDYLNLYTPYRGLLLYYSLGSGKTCTSIAIAEGMKSEKQVVLMTPASLKMNFFSELKKCGDLLYRKNQYWEFISLDGEEETLKILMKALSLPKAYIEKKRGAWMVDIKKPANFSQLSESDQESVDEQLDKMIRAKYIDVNYNGLTRKGLDELTQSNSKNPFDHKTVIIDEAHNFVSRIVNSLKDKKSISYTLYNYLMDATDIRIVLLTGTPIINYPNEIGVLYNILRGYIKTWKFNLRSTGETTVKKIDTETIMSIFKNNGFTNYDYIDYSGKENGLLTITRNPFGFVNKYDKKGKTGGGDTKKKTKTASKTKSNKSSVSKSKTKKEKKISDLKFFEEHNGKITISPLDLDVLDYEETTEYHNNTKDVPQKGAGVFEDYKGMKLDETGNLSDNDFKKAITKVLNMKKIDIVGRVTVDKHKCLPDESAKFLEMFINPNNGEVINKDLFRRRIVGLTSYFRSSQEKLMPRFELTDRGEHIHKEMVEMSDYQFGIYQKIRKEERDREKSMRKKAKQKSTMAQAVNEATTQEVSSSYRIFSRSACNFAFPAEYPRPLPDKKDGKAISENELNGLTSNMAKSMDDYIGDEEKAIEDEEVQSYQERINKVLEILKYNSSQPREQEFLTKEGLKLYSPKFLKVLENIENKSNKGLHLLYSQFRTIEGIGIMKLVLEANGFAEFKLKKTEDGEWTFDIAEEDENKPKFVLYTGTETAEEKEIIRNIYNSSWEFVSPNIVEKLKDIAKNNFMGEVIKLFMITSSGAEGINLRNTRYVHIVEPYWNMVRIDQVVGRARRICSHEDLDEKLRTVKVFLYVSTLSSAQRNSDKNEELRINDLSKRDGKTIHTTDETLLEIAYIKKDINQQILMAMKETAIDCSLYSSKSDENIVCYGSQKQIRTNDFNSYPTLEQDKQVKEVDEYEKISWSGIEIIDPLSDKKYALNEKTKEVFDINSYHRARQGQGNLEKVGFFIKTKKGWGIEFTKASK